jgi:hypothetical protein
MALHTKATVYLERSTTSKPFESSGFSRDSARHSIQQAQSSTVVWENGFADSACFWRPNCFTVGARKQVFDWFFCRIREKPSANWWISTISPGSYLHKSGFLSAGGMKDCGRSAAPLGRMSPQNCIRQQICYAPPAERYRRTRPEGQLPMSDEGPLCL